MQSSKNQDRNSDYTAEYNEYEEFLRNEAKKLGCESSELEVDDDDFNYENLKW